MKKNILKTLALGLLLPSFIGLISCDDNEVNKEPDKPVVPGSNERLKLFESEEVMNSASRGGFGNVDDYYASCKGLKGADLKRQLGVIVNRDKQFISYGGLKDVANVVDEDPNNPNNILLCYTLESAPKLSSFSNNINREHLWPRSIGNLKPTDANSDAHMVRACDASLNSKRGNLPFSSVDHSSANEMDGCFFNGGAFEPPKKTKGDTARTVFYMAVAYDFLELGQPSDTSKYNSWSGSGELGYFDHLYKWATDPSIDPIDSYEMRRNNLVDSEFQHNRNPFVDHPEFIRIIYDKSYDGPGALL